LKFPTGPVLPALSVFLIHHVTLIYNFSSPPSNRTTPSLLTPYKPTSKHFFGIHHPKPPILPLRLSLATLETLSVSVRSAGSARRFSSVLLTSPDCLKVTSPSASSPHVSSSHHVPNMPAASRPAWDSPPTRIFSSQC